MSSRSEKEPLVSVIIPTYNSSGTLRLTLETVLWQDFADFEVWIVGDGCTDDSEKVVNSFADERLRWVNLPSNSGGPSLPRNEGLRRAKGRLIAYLGHDDLWFPWHLSELVDCIETNNSDFAYSLGAILGRAGVIGTFSLGRRPRSPSVSISPSNWLHRKSLTEIVGSWSLNSKVGDDAEFHERVIAADVKLAFRRQLSVLKFPSMEWHTYSLKRDFPQTRYFEAMRRDAASLREELLLEIATLVSHKGLLPNEYGNPLYKLAARAVYFYGLDRWPVNKLLYRRWRQRAGLG